MLSLTRAALLACGGIAAGVSSLNARPGRCRAWLLIALAAALQVGATRADSLTNLYSTQFEAREGYDPVYELIGQNGWITDSSSYGGNGLLTNYLGSQAAYVGLFSLDPLADSLTVWHPVNAAPNTSGKPVVTFSVSMSIVDSTSTDRDDFYWSVYNIHGNRLFTLDFDNYDLGVYYVLDDTTGFHYTGVNFTNEVNYDLTVTMDFAHNTWKALLNNVVIANNLRITTANSPLDLGDVDATWSIYNPSRPGDNFMIFDNYILTAQTSPTPEARLTPVAYGPNGQFQLRLNGTPGARFAIEASTNLHQWVALKTNSLKFGTFSLVDNAGPGVRQRCYRARLVP